MISKKIKIISSIAIILLVAALFFFRKEKKIMDIDKNISSSSITSSLVNTKDGEAVYIKFSFKNQGILQNSPETHGISTIVSHLLFSRIDGLTLEETSEKLMQLGIFNLSVNASSDDLEVSFFTTQGNINEALTFLSNAFKNPTFSNGDLENAKETFPDIPNQELSPPEILMRHTLLGMLYVNDVYGMNKTGTSKVISGITSNDISSFIKNRLHCKNLHVLIAGNISRPKANGYINTLFASLPKGEEKNANRSLSADLSKNDIEVIKKPEMQDIAVVTTGIRLDNLSDLELAATFIIADAIFHNDIGDFTKGLRELGITYWTNIALRRHSLSSVLTVTVYMKKNDVKNYKKYLDEKFQKYSRRITQQNLEKTDRKSVV